MSGILYQNSDLNNDILNDEDIEDFNDNTKYNGGSLYDQGYYGCVFMPKLKCANDKLTLPKNTQVKDGIILDKLIIASQAEEEFDISQTIQEIPLWKNYFIVSESICEPAPIEKQNEKDLSKCKPLENNTLSAFKILRMTFGGVPLNLYKVNANNFPLLDMFKHVLEGISLLTLFGIVHRDLHQGNILIDKQGVARIIDFNLSINARHNITSSDIRHAYTLSPFQEPPDSTLVNAIALGYNGERIINAIINKKSILRNIQSVLGITLEDMYNSLYETYSNSSAIQEGNDAKWFRTYWRTIDSWAVGCNFILIIMKLSLWPEFQSQWKQIKSTMIPVLKKLCEVNPIKRYDAVQALAEIDPQNYIIRKYAHNWLSKVNKYK